MKGLLILIAGIAVVMGGVRWLVAGDPPGLSRMYMAIVQDTVYAPSYSERQFRSLRVGMTAGEVDRVLGPPLRRTQFDSPGCDELWEYSRSPSDSHYYQRWVLFEDGRVSEVLCEYYFD